MVDVVEADDAGEEIDELSSEGRLSGSWIVRCENSGIWR
jgi:hypothetical protein